MCRIAFEDTLRRTLSVLVPKNQPSWATFQFTTEEGGNVLRAELESATHELDERTYRQEFQASFENLTAGLVYFAFDRTRNVEPLRYNPRLPLFWSLDFNVNPNVLGDRPARRRPRSHSG